MEKENDSLESVWTLQKVNKLDLRDPRIGLFKDGMIVPCPFLSTQMQQGLATYPCTQLCLHHNLMIASSSPDQEPQLCVAITCGSGMMIPITETREEEEEKE